MKKRLAIIASGIFSPLSSAVEFANHASSLGYEVQFFAPASSVSLVSFSGFKHHVIPEPKIYTRVPLLPPMDKQGFDVENRLDAAVSSLGVDDLGPVLMDYQPDAVFVDCELHAHIILALSLNLPVVQFSNMFLSRPGLRAPPLHKRSFPGQGLRGSRLCVLLVWMYYLLGKFAKIFRNKLVDRSADHPTALTELSRRHNVPIGSLLRIISWQMPWTYKIPTVLFLPQALDMPTRPYTRLTYVGPMILQARPEIDHDRAKVAAFCNAKDGKKKIFVSFGSMMKPQSGLLDGLWDIARRHPEWRFLYADVKNSGEDFMGKTLDNVDIVPWVTQQEVLKYSDLMIMHGGTGGLVEAVETATPMLIFPHCNDQMGSATRAVYHGIGLAGKKNDPVEKIEADISHLLISVEVAMNCKKMQKDCRKELNENVLQHYLERLTKPD